MCETNNFIHLGGMFFMSSSQLLRMGIGGSVLAVQPGQADASFWQVGLTFFSQYFGVMSVALLFAIAISGLSVHWINRHGDSQL